MLSFHKRRVSSTKAELEGKVAAIDKAQAVIEFTLDGKIQTANPNFLAVVGYSLEEIRGRHHSMFVDALERQGEAYRLFWAKLKRGEYDEGQYRRIAKDGRAIWLQATYNPILDGRGEPYKIVKFATDISKQKARSADLDGQLAAINKSQAVIEFGLDGSILHANENFLKAVGYTLAEIQGRHHSMFVEPGEREGADYRAFWERLRNGLYDARQYKRVGKDNRPIWIQASYNPIMDADGRPYKVVKYATDVTEQVRTTHAIQDVVQQTAAAVEAAKAKDLTIRVSSQASSGDIRLLGEGVNGLLDTLTSIIDAVRDAAQQTVTASATISNGSQDLAMRTEQQASSLEETSATTEELAASVRQSSEHARKAKNASQDARRVAEHGGEVIAQAIEAMARIDTSSKSISDIIAVIDGIAFQTNLLALNAAVEAARAGDAGRGFAVVASEVRALAQRSAEAAKDIKTLISKSSDHVANGVSLVEQAGAVLSDIVSSVGHVAGDMEEIAMAASEQAKGIEEISSAVAHLDELTQQNSTMADDSATTARELNMQIRQLSALVSAFSTERSRAANPEEAGASTRERGIVSEPKATLRSRPAAPPLLAPRLMLVKERARG